MMAKAVFTMIEDSEGEKMTTVIEYGPFETNDKHCVMALMDFLNDQDSEEETPSIPRNAEELASHLIHAVCA